jgi:hypothetical protein
MKKTLLKSILTLFFISNSALASDKYVATDEFGKEKFNAYTESFLKESSLPNIKPQFNEKDLLKVIKNVRKYYAENSESDKAISSNGILGNKGIMISDVLDTLDYMAQILEEDIKEGKETRLKDPNFISKNFDVIRWYPYKSPNKSKEQIRITKYAIFKHKGSKVKTKEFDTALYKLLSPYDENNFYKKYSKQDVLSGIFENNGKEKGKVEPLCYLTREGLEEALMEGTLLVTFPDNTSKFFNVDRNNGITYVKGLKPRNQKRYWYFRESQGINGYGKEFDKRVKIEPLVTFAGDVFNVGLGKIVAYKYKISGKDKLGIGIIGDTGGAFLPNLYQLDFLAGIFNSRKDFQYFSQNLPEYAEAYFLVKK